MRKIIEFLPLLYVVLLAGAAAKSSQAKSDNWLLLIMILNDW